jgi:hypothetical protein
MKNSLYRVWVLIFLFLFCGIAISNAQDIDIKKQTVRGYVTDRTTGNGIAYAIVELLNHSPRLTCVTEENGSFELNNVPVGHQRIRVELEGYYESVHTELIEAGKQAVVTIPVDEEVSRNIATVEANRSTIKDKGRFRNSKMESIDEMNAVSTRAFNIEEVRKYVGGFNDPSRTVTSFPGMYNIDDTENFIISRGNSAYGIQWMIEGVPIENPHHFAAMGNTGAVFPLLNTNLLENSDFVNGALSAQYGNAYSGIFDINLRKGNNERFEFSAQVTTFGVEVTAEGPFKKKGASFAIGVRAAVLELIQLIGLNIGSNAAPHYYDLNFKIDIPTKKDGHLSIFGIGGISNIAFLDAEVDPNDQFAEQGIDRYLDVKTGLLGMTYMKYFNKRTSLKTTLSYLIEDRRSRRDTVDITDPTGIKRIPYFSVVNTRHRVGLASIFNKKITTQFVFRGGVHGYAYYLDLKDNWLQRDENQLLEQGFKALIGGFAQVQYKFSQRFVISLGVRAMYWTLNKNSWAVEPRLALNWYIGKRNKISLGYGWHSKIQSFAMSFFVKKELDGTYDDSNRELGLNRSHHIVLSYDLYLSKFWALKASIYAIYNTDIAVEKNPSSFSLANYGASFNYPKIVGLESTGVSFGYGAELSLEKFFSHGYYGLFSAAYQRATYRGSDMVWRNSAFDVVYVFSLVVGKEFKIGKKKRNVFYVDLRFNLHEGLPYTPIDIDASRLAGEEILIEDKAYSERLNLYKRLDIRIGARFNSRKTKLSHHIYIEAMNFTFFSNDLALKFDANTGETVTAKQFGFFPNLFYQIRF